MDVKQLNILFVDDSQEDSELMSYQIQKAGYSLFYQRVETAEDFSKSLASRSWHAVLCDHNMPHFDLMSALQILKQADVDIPLIIVSGHIPDHIVVDAMNAGAQDFIRKGDFSRLLPVIERELREASIRDGLRKAKENMHRLIHYDAATGLPNREHLLENMRMMIEDHSGRAEFSLVMIRLNYLPQSRFSLGDGLHQALLRNVASRIQGLMADDVYVMSRNCLATIITAVKPKALEASLRKLIELFSHPFTLDGQVVFADCSVGVCGYPESGQSADEILLSAQIALDHTDAQGAAPLCIYSPEMKAGVHERMMLETRIHRALAHKEFFLLFQPQVDIETREIIGAEALLRWRHPELGVVSPVKFIPLLEKTGLIIPIGDWIIRESCRQARLWLDRSIRPIKVAVNLSVEQFFKSSLIATVERALKQSGLPPQCLELEITENIAIRHEEATLKIMSRLKSMGISLSIDDFGAGYSSLAYLQRYPIDLLKIDQSFVRPIQSAASSNADMLRAIIALGHNLNFDVLAEGVETEVQADLILQNGCKKGQGYLFARPMEARFILDKMADRPLHHLAFSPCLCA